MEIHKLTEEVVKNAKINPTKDYRLSDGGGLYLVVTKSGGRLWRWSYEFNGKERLLSYGQFPFVSIDEARRLHAAAQLLKGSGVDPAAAKQEAKRTQKKAELRSAIPTLADFTNVWLEKWSKGRSPRYVTTVTTRLNRDVLKKIGRKRLNELDVPMISDLIGKIEEDGERTDIARRTLQKVKQIMRYATVKGYIDRSPINDLLPNDLLDAHVVTNFARIEPKDLPKLLQKMEVYHGNPVTRLAMKLMALTFVRTESLICAEWSEINFESKRWNIPKEHMKGKSFPHIVPLARQALEILRLLQSLTGASKYLFPGQGPKNHTMSNGTIAKALQGMGYRGEMTGHGFRGLASTILHECGYEHEHIEAQLAHQKKSKVSRAYDYSKYLVPRTRMMQDWADFLEETLRTGKYKLITPSHHD